MSTKVTLGTDPELLIEGIDGVPLKVDEYVRTTDKFGVDGHRYLAELRPEPGVHPKDLLNNIRNTLLLGFPPLGKFPWKVSPWLHEKPMGGHIHFGIPRTDKLCAALDEFAAIFLALVEPSEAAASRRTKFLKSGSWVSAHPYGLLGDYRDKNWGFEWRTPSSFIVSPGVSLGILALIKAILLEEVNEHPYAWTKLSTTIRAELQFNAEDFHNCVRNKFLAKLQTAWKIVSNLTYFSQGQEGRDLWAAVMYLYNKVVPEGGYLLVKDIKTKWNITQKSLELYTRSIVGNEREQFILRQGRNQLIFLPEDMFVDLGENEAKVLAVKNTFNSPLGIKKRPPDEIWTFKGTNT